MSPSPLDDETFDRASALLASVRDVIDERPDGERSPAWSDRRGWTDFLASLSDASVDLAEREGLAAALSTLPDAPDDLAALGRAVQRETALQGLTEGGRVAVETLRTPERKRAQLAALEPLARGVSAGCARVLDLGSGHGHLTRHLARALDLPAEGWERDDARVAVARSLAPPELARFVIADARDGSVRASDLVVGLHACGALGDHAVSVARDAGAPLVLVGCCLQKRDGPRAPLAARQEPLRTTLTLARAVLGLGNARDGDDGIEDDLAVRNAARVHRIALRMLLCDAGLDVAPGEEMRGINRRRATGTLGALVSHAFATRQLPLPDEGSVRRAGEAAERGYARTRRFALARAMLARLIEVWVALDRAESLRQCGYRVSVVQAFDRAISPRNLAVVASRAPAPGVRSHP